MFNREDYGDNAVELGAGVTESNATVVFCSLSMHRAISHNYLHFIICNVSYANAQVFIAR
jgi:hypothetical protein